MVLSDLQFNQNCIQLLENYRKCLQNFKNGCICEQNIKSEKYFNELEDKYIILVTNQITNTTEKHISIDIKNESTDHEYEDNEKSNESYDKGLDPNLDISDNCETENSEDNEVSDEEFIPKNKRPISKRLKTKTNGQKKKKKYVYYNFVCDWIGCERKFSKKDDLMAHISKCHTNEKPFKCEICSKCFAIERYLKSHKISHLSIGDLKSDTESVPNTTFICDINNCGKAFKRTSTLSKHKNLFHSDKKSFVCEWPGCGASYKTNDSLIIHKSIHSDETEFKCDVEGCVKTFKTKWSYFRHISRHKAKQKLSKYICDWPGCEHDAKTKQGLIVHRNRHMNVKPFKCETVDCQMSYFTSYELKQHKIKVHEVINKSDRQFKCHLEGCHMSYAVERDLKRHLRRHDRIHVCSWPECAQTYYSKQLLADHMDRHLNVKSFHCLAVGCGKSFFSKNNFLTHTKKMHKNK